MLPINKLIKDRFIELCPQLKLDGFDTIVWKWCKKDMLLYLNYLEKHRTEVVSSAIIKYVKVYYYGMMLSQPLLLLQNQADSYNKEFQEWANMWIGLWWTKFQQRVKLQLNAKPKRMLKTESESKDGRSIWNKLSQKEKDYIFGNAMKTLLENGEIVRPRVIITHQIYIRLSQKMKKKKEWKPEDTINFAKSLRDTLKYISYTHGPLLFLYPSKQAYVSEWRNYGETTA